MLRPTCINRNLQNQLILSRHGHLARRARDRLRLRDLSRPESEEQARAVQCQCLACREAICLSTPPRISGCNCIREQIGLIHAVIYTHEHADHLFGLDDLRIFADYLGHDLPVYCTETVESRIRKAYDYAFDEATRHYQAGGIPKLVLRRIPVEPIEILGRGSRPFRSSTAAMRRSASASATWPIAPTPTASRDSELGIAPRARRVDSRWPSPPPASDAFHAGGSGRDRPAIAAAANALHAHLPRPGARGDQRRLAAGNGTGVRRAGRATFWSAVIHYRFHQPRSGFSFSPARRSSTAVWPSPADSPTA